MRNRIGITFLLGAALTWAATPSTVTLGPVTSPVVYGTQVTLTATAAPVGATGKVTFYDGVSVLGTAPLAGGTATLATRFIPAGAHALRARYQGDASFDPSVSGTASLQVNPVLGQGFAGRDWSIPNHYAGYSAVTGDFNEDGLTDVLVANYYTGDFTPQFGDGAGGFTPGSPYDVGTYPISVITADFNEDGHLDLAVSSNESGTILVILGAGNGTFSPGGLLVAGTNPASLTYGDFNGDGHVDIAVANRSSNNVSVLLGNGLGGFASSVSYAGGTYPVQVAAADINADGITDLATVNAGSQDLSLWLGLGNGIFQGAQYVPLPEPPQALTFGDFNEDGLTDIVVAMGASSGVLFGLGGGAFNYVSVGSGGLPVSVATGDFNADSHLDFVVSNGAIRLFKGDGNGGFVEAVYDLGVSASSYLLTGEFNGDGRIDLFYIDRLLLGLPPSDVRVTKTHSGDFFQGQTGATYTITVDNLGPFPAAGPFAVYDTLPAGLTQAQFFFGTGWTCNIGVPYCKRNDTLAAGASFPPITAVVNVSGSAPLSVTNTAQVSGTEYGDSNPSNDTAADPTLIVQNQGIFFGTLPDRLLSDSPFQVSATATSGLPVSFSAGGSCSIAQNVVTLSAQGQCSITASQAGNQQYFPAPDVVSSFQIVGASSSVQLTVPASPSLFGSATLLTANVTPADATGKVTFYDGERILGIRGVLSGAASLTGPLTRTGPRKLWVHFSGDSNYAPSSSTKVAHTVITTPAFRFTGQNFATGLQPPAVIAGDFNGDMQPDIAVAGGYTTEGVYLSTGGGSFGARIAFPGTQSTSGLAAADVNGDGKLDLVVRRTYPSPETAVYLGNGDGTFSVAASTVALIGPPLIADMDNDGDVDIVVPQAKSVGVALGNGDGTFTVSPAIDLGAGFANATLGDLNGDGFTDVVAVLTDYSLNPTGKVLARLFGKGDGTLLPAIKTPIDTVGDTAADWSSLGDLNGDGILDLVIANASTYVANLAGVSVSVALGVGDGTFSTARTFRSNTSSPAQSGHGSAIVFADLNGDGKQDVLTNHTYSSTGAVQAFLGLGDGGLEPGALEPVAGVRAQMEALDFNADGRVDLLSIDGNNFRILYGDTGSLLRVSIDHAGTPYQGQPMTFDITVSNDPAAAPSAGPVTVYDSLWTGLSMSLSGAGWTCQGTCTRADVLAPGASYPPISGTTYSNVTSPVVNEATVSGGSSMSRQALDVVDLLPLPVCTLQVNPLSDSVPAAGGSGSIAVTAPAECTWSVNAASWLTVTSGSGGSGNGTVEYTASANLSPDARIGWINVSIPGYVTVQQTVNQAGSPNRMVTTVFRDVYGGIRAGLYPSTASYSAGGVFASDPRAADDLAGNTFVVARDTFNAVWVNVFHILTQTWDDWGFAGGSIQGTPAIAVTPSGKAFFAARDAYDAYWVNTFQPGVGFGTWRNLGGVFSTDPEIAAAADGSLYLVGKDHFGAIWSAHFTTDWGTWSYGGAVVVGSPSVTCGVDSAAYVAVRDASGAVWMGKVVDNVWDAWSRGAGVFPKDPRIAASAGGAVYVTDLDASGALWYRGYSGGWWGNGWTFAGGVLATATPSVRGLELYVAGRASQDLWWYRANGPVWTYGGNHGLVTGNLAGVPH